MLLRLKVFVTRDIVQRFLWIVQIFFFSDSGTKVPKYILENI